VPSLEPIQMPVPSGVTLIGNSPMVRKLRHRGWVVV
jgi:hypothetical protein